MEEDQKNLASEEIINKELTDAEFQEIMKDAEALAEAQLKLAVDKLRALPAQRVLSPRQHEVLLSIKEEELTDDDKLRLKWATLRLPTQRYTGKDYTHSEKKLVKSKRQMTKKSRAVNRVK